MKKSCLICSQPITKPCNETRNRFLIRHKFCSRKCKDISQVGKVPTNKTAISKRCLTCDSQFEVPICILSRGFGKYCSRDCKNKSQVGKSTWNKGKKTGPQSLELRLKRSQALKGKTPSGERHHNWKGGVYPINEAVRDNFQYKLWAKTIKERDNYTCQICGTVGGVLHSHHIKKFADYPELRFELLNGTTVCKKCDYELINNHEQEWESYFTFMLKIKGFLPDEHLPMKEVAYN